MIEKKLIGRLRNNWRRRDVEVFEIEGDPEHVLSVGQPFDDGEVVECVERRTDWQRVIAMFPELAVYD